jgi:hypothetical protein
MEILIKIALGVNNRMSLNKKNSGDNKIALSLMVMRRLKI